MKKFCEHVAIGFAHFINFNVAVHWKEAIGNSHLPFNKKVSAFSKVAEIDYLERLVSVSME